MPATVIALAASKFPLGDIVITSNAHSRLKPADIAQSLSRHGRGDWGDVDEDDWELDGESLKGGSRLLSVYRSGDQRFWIITEADRSVTTILLPEDY